MIMTDDTEDTDIWKWIWKQIWSRVFSLKVKGTMIGREPVS